MAVKGRKQKRRKSRKQKQSKYKPKTAKYKPDTMLGIRNQKLEGLDSKLEHGDRGTQGQNRTVTRDT